MAEKGNDKEISNEEISMALDGPDLYDSYREVQEKTLELYSKDIGDILELAIVGTSFVDVFASVNASGKIAKPKYSVSLLSLSSCELAKIRGRIIFLTTHGLYREANVQYSFPT